MAISPVPIIAVILMLFSQRARVNGPVFLLGWVLALAVVSTVVYVLAHDGDVAHQQHGVGLGVVGQDRPRRRAARPGAAQLAQAPGARRRSRDAQVAGDASSTLSPRQGRSGSASLLAAVNPKNLILTAGCRRRAGPGSGLSTSDAVVAIVVFVGDRQPHHRRARASTRCVGGRAGQGERSTRPRRG